ncbi:hypothetical protein PJ912_00670 [Pectobacterium colocasium]|uniref:hypothetical protein n=1 Tax=Pectobacterium TaxID=122277 RepID=UPI0027A5972B|nr:hypothetical protein PJ912_00670 [Pectobacterium colocasium]
MRNDKINLIMFIYLTISCALAMFFLFFLLNLMFSIVDFLREGEFNFTWETAIDCFTLGAITGPIAALGIWFMLRFRM